MTVINYTSESELNTILDRLNMIGCKWNSGHKANDLSWDSSAYGSICKDMGSITVGYRMRLTCGDHKDYGTNYDDFVNAPVNYLLVKEDVE